jgi:hypothetical protein
MINLKIITRNTQKRMIIIGNRIFLWQQRFQDKRNLKLMKLYNFKESIKIICVIKAIINMRLYSC